MNYASPEKSFPLTGNRHPLERSLLTQIEALKDRLANFTVVDAQGETMGEIRNLVLYKRRLHLVIVQPDAHRHWRFVLLSSPLVQQVNLRDRTIFVHTTPTDVSYLPEQRSLTKRANISAHASVLAPVSQLPASPLIDRTHCSEPAEQPMVLLEPIALKAKGKVKVPLVMESSEMPKVVADMIDASVARSSNTNKESNKTYHAPAYPVVTPTRPVTVGVSERLP